jgi:hypothetical protein
MLIFKIVRTEQIGYLDKHSSGIIPILLESGIDSDVMRPIAAPIVGGMITLNNSRTDSGASVLCPYERTSTAAWHAAGGATETVRIDLSHAALNNIGRVHKPCWNGGEEWPASSRGGCTNIVRN